MDFRFLLSHSLAKATKFIIKNISKGGATAAPGFFSLYIDQNTLKKLAANLETTLLITGTNGKTTTTRLISAFFDEQKTPYIHNRHGSNLERGLISGFMEHTNLLGETRVKTGLFEVDEAALANVLPKLSPKTVVITNLFRDQLDRYGEVDSILSLWKKCIASLDQSTNLILNGDDPSLAYLGQNASCRVAYFGIEDPRVALKEVPAAVDSVNCPKCSAKLVYEHYYISHQGLYHCPSCEFKRPDITFSAGKISFETNSTEFVLSDAGDLKIQVETPFHGLFNVYNILAAYGGLKSIEANLDTFPTVIKQAKPAFGRSEKLEVQGHKIQVNLAKNPTGFNEIIRTFMKGGNQTVLIVINDQIADGRDVSWLWDVDFENLAASETKFFVSGLRAQDMGLRLKYAGIRNYEIVTSLPDALEKAVANLREKDTLLVVPTYTAMLSLKKLLASKGASSEFWEE